ncbi:uncharacterized protein LOC114742576 [Neltuma alba]|uniref:uncharacterized protein LOC114742576 n=1 Tax=Neltuma alba TaxID=207710 RepID=UPI0010A48FAC|nr:uncharacterized protein LOC114742576 [Prosopis alba]
MQLGYPQNDLDLSPGKSLDGSFRKSSSVISAAHSVSATSGTSKFVPISRRVYRGLKDCGRKLLDLDIFTQNLEDWVLENLHANSEERKQYFSSPFTTSELRKLDLALEGVSFQQLVRMPNSSEVSDDLIEDHLIEDQYLAVEDFLHATIIGLWRTFWHKSGPLPLFVSCTSHPGSKFYSVEKAISRGRLKELRGLALMAKTGCDLKARWDQVVSFALFRPEVISENGLRISSRTIFVDSKHGGVVRLSGDLGKLDLLNSSNPYQSVAEWIKTCADVGVTPAESIWNRLGNANWGDMGTLQVLLATFYSIAQWRGPPRKSVASLISDHGLRLQKRRTECCIIESENALIPYQGSANYEAGEIVELDENDFFLRKQTSRLKLKQGEYCSWKIHNKVREVSRFRSLL